MTDNFPIKANVNKIENRITFKIKTGYYLEHLAPGTMKLLGRTNVVGNMIHESCIHLFPTNHFINY